MEKNRTRKGGYQKIIEEEPLRKRSRKLSLEEPKSGATRTNQKVERRAT